MLTAYKEENANGDEKFHALQDLGIGLHHMVHVNRKMAHDVFDVPAGFHISTAVAVG